jgi:hypothetical protein
MKYLDREQALRLVNEQVGQDVGVVVEIEIGDLVTGLLHLEGTLTQLRLPEGKEPALPIGPGDEPSGLYSVGDASVYLPEQGYRGITESVAGPGIHVDLCENVGLRINWRLPQNATRTTRALDELRSARRSATLVCSPCAAPMIDFRHCRPAPATVR